MLTSRSGDVVETSESEDRIAFELRVAGREPRRDELDLYYTDSSLAEMYDTTCG